MGITPKKKKFFRNPMVPCCRRHHPWRRKTFLDNSEFLRFRPAPTPTSLHNLKAAHLATISKDIHTDSQLQVGKTRKTAVLGRIRSSSAPPSGSSPRKSTSAAPRSPSPTSNLPAC